MIPTDYDIKHKNRIVSNKTYIDWILHINITNNHSVIIWDVLFSKRHWVDMRMLTLLNKCQML